MQKHKILAGIFSCRGRSRSSSPCWINKVWADADRCSRQFITSLRWTQFQASHYYKFSKRGGEGGRDWKTVTSFKLIIAFPSHAYPRTYTHSPLCVSMCVWVSASVWHKHAAAKFRLNGWFEGQKFLQLQLCRVLCKPRRSCNSRLSASLPPSPLSPLWNIFSSSRIKNALFQKTNGDIKRLPPGLEF